MVASQATPQTSPPQSASHQLKIQATAHTAHHSSPRDTAEAPSRCYGSKSPASPPPPNAAPPRPLENPASAPPPGTPEPASESLRSHSQTPAPPLHYRHHDPRS